MSQCLASRSMFALLETTSFALSLAGPILIALVGFTIFAAEVRVLLTMHCDLSDHALSESICSKQPSGSMHAPSSQIAAPVKSGIDLPVAPSKGLRRSLLPPAPARGTRSAQGGQLRASVAFPALALFDLLREPIRMLPSSITACISTFVAQKRLQEFVGVRSDECPCLRPASVSNAQRIPAVARHDCNPCAEVVWVC